MSGTLETQRLAAEIAQAVERRLGDTHPDIARAIAAELNIALCDLAIPPTTRLQGDASRVVITAHGRNRTGVVTRLAAAIEEFDGDVRDLSQTIVGDYYTMLWVVDVPDTAAEGARFLRLRERLKEVGGDVGAHVVVMHDDILSAMHGI